MAGAEGEEAEVKGADEEKDEGGAGRDEGEEGDEGVEVTASMYSRIWSPFRWRHGNGTSNGVRSNNIQSTCTQLRAASCESENGEGEKQEEEEKEEGERGKSGEADDLSVFILKRRKERNS